MKLFNQANAVRLLQFVSLLLITAAVTFAQSSSLGRAVQGISTELISVVHYIGIIMVIGCGVFLMAGGSGAIAKMAGLGAGLVLMLFAGPLVDWAATLG